MKLVFRLFILFSLLLSGGSSVIFATVHQDNSFYFSLKTHKNSAEALLTSLQSLQSSSVSINKPGADFKHVKIFAEENEDESHAPVALKKKSTPATNSYFARFYDFTSGYFCRCIKRCSPSIEHFTHISSCRYIIFQVIRI